MKSDSEQSSGLKAIRSVSCQARQQCRRGASRNLSFSIWRCPAPVQIAELKGQTSIFRACLQAEVFLRPSRTDPAETSDCRGRMQAAFFALAAVSLDEAPQLLDAKAKACSRQLRGCACIIYMGLRGTHSCFSCLMASQLQLRQGSFPWLLQLHFASSSCVQLCELFATLLFSHALSSRFSLLFSLFLSLPLSRHSSN